MTLALAIFVRAVDIPRSFREITVQVVSIGVRTSQESFVKQTGFDRLYVSQEEIFFHHLICWLSFLVRDFCFVYEPGNICIIVLHMRQLCRVWIVKMFTQTDLCTK